MQLSTQMTHPYIVNKDCPKDLQVYFIGILYSLSSPFLSKNLQFLPSIKLKNKHKSFFLYTTLIGSTPNSL